MLRATQGVSEKHRKEQQGFPWLTFALQEMGKMASLYGPSFLCPVV